VEQNKYFLLGLAFPNFVNLLFVKKSFLGKITGNTAPQTATEIAMADKSKVLKS